MTFCEIQLPKGHLCVLILKSVFKIVFVMFIIQKLSPTLKTEIKKYKVFAVSVTNMYDMPIPINGLDGTQ